MAHWGQDETTALTELTADVVAEWTVTLPFMMYILHLNDDVAA